jgi:type 1 fimbria pilin
MKNNIKPALCSLLVMMASGYANAATVASPAKPTGTVSIAGKILDKGCTFEAKDLVIQLTPVVISSFTAVGDMGPKSDPVNFNLTGCPANTALTFTVQGTKGANTLVFATATDSTNATGLDFFLYGPATETSYIRPNMAQTLTPDSSGNFSGKIYAQLRSNTATVTAGKIDTTLTYTLAYN